MPLGWIAGASLIGAGVSYVEGQEGNRRANSVAEQQQYQSATIFGEQQSFETQLSQLMADPNSVTGLPGYKFNLDQGSENLSRQMAAQGLRGSGNQMAALQTYGENYAMNTFNQQASLLASLSGITAASSPSQALGNAGETYTDASALNQKNLNSEFSQLGILGGRFGTLGSGTSSSSPGMPAGSSTTVPAWGPPS